MQVLRGFVVEPVYADKNSCGYKKANRFVQGFLQLPFLGNDELIDPKKGDVFLGLDLQPEVVVNQKRFLDTIFLIGVKVIFLVYDLIPIKHPGFFPEGAKLIFQRWMDTITNYDRLICIRIN